MTPSSRQLKSVLDLILRTQAIDFNWFLNSNTEQSQFCQVDNPFI